MKINRDGPCEVTLRMLGPGDLAGMKSLYP
jgi:hypothetical protein